MAQDVLVIDPEGDLDLFSARSLAPRLQQAVGDMTRRVIVDLSAVTLVDSSALGALVQADQRLRRLGRRLPIVVPAGSAAAVTLDLTQLGERLAVFQTREDAVASLA